MRGHLLVGLAAAALFAAAPVEAAVPTGNLLVNPGAEAGPGAADSATQLPLPGWTVESTFTAVQYGTSGFPTLDDATTFGGGVNLFAGGNSAASAATQLVDVSGAAPEIDAGTLEVTLSALLGGFSSQTDRATVTASFLGAGAAPLGALNLAPVTAADRASVTTFVARSASALLPAGTRSISVRIDAIRDEGSYNDGYIDNVSLVLGAGGGTPVFHKTVVVKAISGKVRVRRPGSNNFVDLSGSEGIPLGSTVDTLAGVVELSSVPKAGGKPQTGRFYEGVFKVTQPGSVTSLALTEPLASCRGGGRSAAATKKKQRHLWGDAKGSFRTAGKYSSATVRGTKWLVKDSCAGTLTRVVRGTVTVRDRVRAKTVVVAAGKSYLAKPGR
ncbi:MAG TPA: hypothetical protein VF080_11700 [Solirubrobacteraceae bacterium]